MTSKERGEELSEPEESVEAYRHPADHSWSLQIMLDLKGSVGELKEAIRTLQKDSEKQGDKLNTVSHQIYAAGAVLVIVIAIASFLLDKLWGPLMKALEHSAH
jgi:hypothetical protein